MLAIYWLANSFVADELILQKHCNLEQFKTFIYYRIAKKSVLSLKPDAIDITFINMLLSPSCLRRSCW